MDPGFKNVIEFRHHSWWNENVFRKFQKNKITFCSVSHPALPDTLIATTPIAYVRLHGTPQMFYSNYTTPELNLLREIILKKTKIKTAFVYFNNTAGIAGIKNAQRFKAITG